MTTEPEPSPSASAPGVRSALVKWLETELASVGGRSILKLPDYKVREIIAALAAFPAQGRPGPSEWRDGIEQAIGAAYKLADKYEKERHRWADETPRGPNYYAAEEREAACSEVASAICALSPAAGPAPQGAMRDALERIANHSINQAQTDQQSRERLANRLTVVGEFLVGLAFENKEAAEAYAALLFVQSWLRNWDEMKGILAE